MHTYACFYNKRRIEVRASSSLEAQTIAAAKFKTDMRKRVKRWDVTIALSSAQSVAPAPAGWDRVTT